MFQQIRLPVLTTLLSALWLGIPTPHNNMETSEIKGYALIIANSRYPVRPLPNVSRDSDQLKRLFDSADFKTVTLNNATIVTLNSAVRQLRDIATRDRVPLFLYYAGHGIRLNGEDRLIVSDTSVETDMIDATNSIAVRDWLDTFDHNRRSANIIVFDMCRSRHSDEHAQRIALRIPDNTLVVHSTLSGQPALDGTSGQVSPFVHAMIQHWPRAYDSIQRFFESVTRTVHTDTRWTQRPELHGSLPDSVGLVSE